MTRPGGIVRRCRRLASPTGSSSPRRARATAAAAIVVGVLAFGPCAAAGADSDGAAGQAHVAACVASLKTAAAALAADVRAGQTGADAELHRVTQAGYAFVGEAYKAGLGKEDADRLLDRAEEEQKRWSDAARRRLQAECRAEGDRLYAAANPLERAMVDAAANKRARRLVEK